MGKSTNYSENHKITLDDIPAESIKKALIDSNLESPLENLISIGKATFTLIHSLNPNVVDCDLINSFGTLEYLFLFNISLVDFDVQKKEMEETYG